MKLNQQLNWTVIFGCPQWPKSLTFIGKSNIHNHQKLISFINLVEAKWPMISINTLKLFQVKSNYKQGISAGIKILTLYLCDAPSINKYMHHSFMMTKNQIPTVECLKTWKIDKVSLSPFYIEQDWKKISIKKPFNNMGRGDKFGYFLFTMINFTFKKYSMLENLKIYHSTFTSHTK